MELSQIQCEAIESASLEGPIEPGAFARGLLHDTDATVAAFASLEQQGLMRQDRDGRFSLTEDGETLQQRRAAEESAAVKRGTPTWQPR